MVFDGYLIAFGLWIWVSLSIIEIADAHSNVTNVDSDFIASGARGTEKASTTASSTSERPKHFLPKLDDRIVFESPSYYNRPGTTTTHKPVQSDDNVMRTVNATGEYTLRYESVRDARVCNRVGLRVGIDSNLSLIVCFVFVGSVVLKDGTKRGETGEYELRNGRRVFIIRGYFGRVTESVEQTRTSIEVLASEQGTIYFQNNYEVTAYVFDHTGYHEIPIDSTTDGEGIIDLRPDQPGADCDLAAGQYCIDQKLLAILVG